MLGENGHREQQLSLMAEYALRVSELAQAQSEQASSAEGLQREAALQLERANQVKSDFISQMSHELRTPLNAMIGFSKLIKGHGDHPLSEAEIVSYADLINTAACRLLTFVNDVLELSKLQSGHHALTREDIDVGDALAGIVADLRPHAERHGIDLTFDATGDTQVDGDIARLRRALRGVIENAIRFTPEGGCVELSVGPRDGQVEIVVRDSGIGMSQEDIALALAPFGVPEFRKRSDGARGLGLPLAKALVAAHGGSIGIESAKGNGTTVRIALPALPVVNAASPSDLAVSA
jgi:two-component system cell cycle sensor histidine kinase PleC